MSKIKYLYEDANQKVGKHTTKNKYWKSHGIVVDRSHRLLVGDYVLKLEGAKISVDTKQNILEIAVNMFCDSTRFQKECMRAKNNGILLIFLIEESCDKKKLLEWRSKKDAKGQRFINVYGKQIYKKMKEYSILYGVKFRFCHKNSTGKRVLELLEPDLLEE